MEFYKYFSIYAPLSHSFNSQRDGILRRSARISKIFDKRFNSQRDGILRDANGSISAERRCFNSQRDGILHNWEKEKPELIRFQFPTGWNSTE